MKPKITLLFLLMILAQVLPAQVSVLGDTAVLTSTKRLPARFLYNVDFSAYFDNREYKAPYQVPQTFLNFRLSPELGVQLSDVSGGKHSLIAGVRYTQALGGDWSNIQVIPTAYYRLDHSGFRFSMGAIPYEQRLSVLPAWLMYDSLVYMHPNIQGALLSYHSAKGYAELMCDWRGSQTTYRQEMFRIIANGEYRYKYLLLGGLAHMNHKASFAKPRHEHVMDDVNLSAHAGVDVSSLTPLDSLTLRIGYIFGWQRDRAVHESFYAYGCLIDLYANWRFIGLKNTLYVGDNLQPLRPRNDMICLGEPFYQSPLYNRTDLFLYIYRRSFINIYFSWNMHYDLHHLQHQQQLIARFNLDGIRHSERKLRGLFDK